MEKEAGWNLGTSPAGLWSMCFRLFRMIQNWQGDIHATLGYNRQIVHASKEIICIALMEP